jgi:hypothetical protein
MTDLIKIAINKGYDLFGTKLEIDLIDLISIQQWLINEHNIHVNPIAKFDHDIIFYTVSILTLEDDDIYYSSYKQALKSGLMKALVNKL